MSRSSRSSPPISPLSELDSFVDCLRKEMEDTSKIRSKKHVKVPKAETSGFRNDILSHLKTNFGIMNAGTIIEIINKHFRIFMDRQGWAKRKLIGVGMKGVGADPSTKNGKKWWLSGMGCADESEPVILGNQVAFEPSGEYYLYFENFKTCLNQQLEKEKPRAALKKKKRRTKKKKPPTKKKKDSRKRHSPKKKKDSRKKKRRKR